MPASPSEILNSATATKGLGAEATVQLTVRATPAVAALIRRAAASRQISVRDFMLAAAMAEAERGMSPEGAYSTPTDHHRLILLNEVLDRLAVALGESAKSVDALGDLVTRAENGASPLCGR
jgi:uncharacterized protein (DUF1778 family)